MQLSQCYYFVKWLACFGVVLVRSGTGKLLSDQISAVAFVCSSRCCYTWLASLAECLLHVACTPFILQAPVCEYLHVIVCVCVSEPCVCWCFSSAPTSHYNATVPKGLHLWSAGEHCHPLRGQGEASSQVRHSLLPSHWLVTCYTSKSRRLLF